MAENLSYKITKSVHRAKILFAFFLVFVCSCNNCQRDSISFCKNQDIFDSLMLYAEAHDNNKEFLITRPMDRLSDFDNTSGFFIGPMFNELKSYFKHSFYFNESGKKFYIYNDLWGYFVKQKDDGESISAKEKGEWADYYNKVWYIRIDPDLSITVYKNVDDMIPTEIEANVKAPNTNLHYNKK